MKLSVALKIIEEQYNYVKSVDDYDEDGDFDINSPNGHNIEEMVVVADWQFKDDQGKWDKSKLFVTFEARHGGEGEGDDYWLVYKIDHPEHGVGYIKYQGYYDSWNGVEWNEKYMVEPYEVTVTRYRPTK